MDVSRRRYIDVDGMHHDETLAAGLRQARIGALLEVDRANRLTLRWDIFESIHGSGDSVLGRSGLGDSTFLKSQNWSLLSASDARFSAPAIGSGLGTSTAKSPVQISSSEEQTEDIPDCTCRRGSVMGGKPA